MFFPIQQIKIPNESHFCLNSSEERSESIEYLSKINIFVGENNSGKSLFVRNLVSKQNSYLPQSEFITILNSVIETIKADSNDYLKRKRLEGFSKITPLLEMLQIIDFINEDFNIGNELSNLKKQIDGLKANKSTSSGNMPHSRIGEDLEGIFYNALDPLSNYINIHGNLEEDLKKPKLKKIYIPILRGIRPINSTGDTTFDDKDVFKIRTMSDYFQQNEDDFEIFTGLDIYTKVKTHLLGNLYQRDLIKEYEQYLSKNFFDSKTVTLIPKEGSDVLTIKIGEEMERPIYDLGDGLQSIIILTMPLFLNRGQFVLFFYEEPEQYLHPGLQRKLLEILLHNQKTYQYFMTTHSNHFLDITLDYSEISIYGFRKELDAEYHSDEKTPTFLIENLSHGDQSLLELLGVKNSSVFLSNCTIWVEGITDRLYLKRYFELYLKKLEVDNPKDYKQLREDYHYSYVEYGGNNITHWSFLDDPDDDGVDDTINVKRLCGKLLLIVDQDKGKDKRHQKLEEALGDNFCRLNCKEIENLLSKKVLLKVIEEYEARFKNENPEIQEFNEEDYRDEYLGTFIESKLANQKRKSYKAESGTVSAKSTFCKKALSHIQEYDDLSEEAIKLCEKIYGFILMNNP